ncbi:MAG: hypothetical protein K8R67_10960 [Desulfobacteraceae bacterium]|nr:hypothetical protein [Desulfobacteraceae bacterium]
MDFIKALEGRTKEMQLSLIKNKLKSLKIDIETEVAGETLDNLLFLLLKAMGLLFLINKDYRKNIKDFTGTYVICSMDKKIDVSAIFKKIPVFFTKIDGMEVKDSIVDNATTTVTFKDGKAMADFLLSGNTDVIAGMLNNQLSVSGNLNYLFKFVYLLWLIPELLGINDFKELLSQPA